MGGPGGAFLRCAGVVAAVVAIALAPTASPATQQGRLPRLDAPRELKVVSYFPANAGWTLMWERWDPARIDADLARAAALRANTVRVVVQATLFGYPDPEAMYLRRLRDFVDLAERRGLHVQLTIFDWWGEYADLAGSRRWARALLEPYVGDPRIAVVELRNEIDPFDPSAATWARSMIPFVRNLLGGQTPVTISSSGPQPLSRLRKLVGALGRVRPDFFSLHYFGGGGEGTYRAFAKAKALVAPTPLWIGETGYPTYPRMSGYAGVPLTAEAQEAAQAHFLKTAAWAARAHRLPPIAVWVLDDFEPGGIPAHFTGPGGVVIPTDVGRREPEYHFGLYRADGGEKPAAGVMRTVWATGKVPTEFNNGFERGAAGDEGANVPAEWGMHGEGADVCRDATVARRGSSSARIAPRATAAGDARLWITPIEHSSCAGRRARASVWARGAAVTGDVRLTLTWRDWSNVVLRRVSSAPLASGTTGWSRLSASGRTPRGAVYVRLDLTSSRNGGTVWFDDVAFAWASGSCSASAPSSVRR